MSHNIWSFCLSRLQEELPPQQFNTWIKVLSVDICKDEDNAQTALRLSAPSRFILQWVKERYLSRIKELANECAGKDILLDIGLAQPSAQRYTPTQPTNGATQPATAPIHAASTPLTASQPVPQPTAQINGSRPVSQAAERKTTHEKTPVDQFYAKTCLNSMHTFDTLVTGQANDLARAAALSVSKTPGTSYNPLFIYGGVGLGKTHLVHAIGNAIYQDNPDCIVRYIHVHDYYSDVVRAYQQKSFDVFKRYYRSLDVLIIDDIQFFNNKSRTQEEFFHAFNALTEAKKQIIITCDTYPKDVQGLEERLVSRCDWGLTVEIKPPELEMRVAILQKKASELGTHIDNDVAFLIAKNLRSNVRELEGALNKVLAFANFHARPISLELAKEALKDLLKAHNRQLSVEQIQKTVADYYKIKVADMHSKKRTRVIARPRQIAMWLAKELTPMSLPAIGEAFGGRDHSTVLHAHKTISQITLTDQQINHDVHVLTQVLRG